MDPLNALLDWLAGRGLEIVLIILGSVLLARLVAWIGSHAGTELSRSMGADYTQGSCALAEAYLSRFG